MNLRIAPSLVAVGVIYCVVLAAVARLSVETSPESPPAPPKVATPQSPKTRVPVSRYNEELMREIEEELLRGGPVQFHEVISPPEDNPSRPIRPGERPQTLPPYYPPWIRHWPASSPGERDSRDDLFPLKGTGR
jgi:hypothetical protein